MSAEQRIPDLYAEQDALGELPLNQDRDMRRRLDKEPERSTRMQELQESNEQILADYPAELMAAKIILREQQTVAEFRPNIVRRLAIVGVPAALLVALAVWFLLPDSSPIKDPSKTGQVREDIQYKGDPHLVIHRQRAAGSEELAPGDTARAGDLLQIRYVAEHAKYGVIFSIDGRGQVNLHFPLKDSGSTVLQPGKTTSLPFSYELDDAPGFERFFFVTSAKPIEIGAIIEAARKLAAQPGKQLDLPPGVKQKEFLISKPDQQRRH
jgi:uncharacterized protein DUF4384